ncbi:MAG TPA: Stp1/IreP family PP2C-type Ser/Thr phosphatase [Acidimicrobiia bacterium]|nr:Stp1/IreP family PP2C-type Ser/Thr phosphatase [Acidimicrobiia bacterium]
MKLAAASATDQGLVRSNNEDSFLVDDQRALFAVADGMGGHRGGEVASRTAIEALRAAVANGAALDDAITRANAAVLNRASGDDELTGMGTTITAVIAVGGRQLLIGHVGDSRAYLLHHGEMVRQTNDHSLVEELVREGRLTPEQAESHPQRAIVTRALGVDDHVDVDLYTLQIEPGDRLVLCSDGLTTMVRERDIERIARNEPDPQRLADALVAAANTAGGEDNTTVVVIDVLETETTAADPIALAGEPDATTTSRSAVIAPPDPAEPKPAKAPRVKGARRRAVRGVILVLLPLLLIVGAATAALGWYARSSYFVGASGSEVVIYKGVPGGVLGWNPTVDQHTGLTVADLPTLDRSRVETNSSRGSLATARAYVERLTFAATSTTTTSTTTTTVKRKPTTRKPTTPTTRRATPTTKAP